MILWTDLFRQEIYKTRKGTLHFAGEQVSNDDYMLIMLNQRSIHQRIPSKNGKIWSLPSLGMSIFPRQSLHGHKMWLNIIGWGVRCCIRYIRVCYLEMVWSVLMTSYIWLQLRSVLLFTLSPPSLLILILSYITSATPYYPAGVFLEYYNRTNIYI